VAGWIGAFWLGHNIGGTRHGFGSTGDYQLVVAGADRIAAVKSGVQGRAAQSIDGHRRDRRRESGEKGRHAGNIAVFFAGAVGIAKDDVIDSVAIQVWITLD